VPLFVEELTKAVVEAGADRGYVSISAVSPSSLAVPATLHASLLGRLDRLGSLAKNVAQVGAAIGRDFSYELLAAAVPLTEPELQEALRRLVEAGLVFQHGVPPTADYLFKHALVQDTAYSTLLRGPRQALHLRIAEALERWFPDLVETRPEILAQHYAEAGLIEKSVAYWGKAGHRSAARSALAEAARQFQKALDQLTLLPGTRDRQRQELEFWIALGAVLQAVKGFGASETGDAYSRARELWEQLGSPSQFLGVPFGQAVYYMMRGKLDLALRLDEDLLRLSRQRRDSSGVIVGHFARGRELMYAGRFASSRSHLEKAFALFDPISHASLVHQTGTYPHVNAQSNLGYVLFFLGYPDQGLAQSRAAIAGAGRLAHPPSLAVTLGCGTMLALLAEDHVAFGEWVGQMVAIAIEQSFDFWRAYGTICRGWIKVTSGDVTQGVSLLRTGLAAYRATGGETYMPHHIALLARACEIAERIEEGLSLLDEALEIAEITGERWFAAELNRHKGRLLLQQGHAHAAEELYRQALSIAEEQKAKLWELRAAMSLARLCRDQGRSDARDLLAPVYGWFTEGFDTPDLKQAKALLHELA
jgi:predicted ATPase